MNGETPKPSMTIQNTLAIIITVSFVGLIFVWLFYPPKGDPNTYSLLTTLIGFLGAAFGTVIQYHFGSSKGSSEKDETISKMAKAPAGTGDGTTTTTTTTTKIPPVTNGEAETAAWNDAVNADTAASYEDYLKKFPAGVHATEAAARAAKSNP